MRGSGPGAGTRKGRPAHRSGGACLGLRQLLALHAFIPARGRVKGQAAYCGRLTGDLPAWAGPVKDADCTDFLRWALPRLGMRWAGFRRVRRQVCKRLRRRIADLGLRGLAGYPALLEKDSEEWTGLDGLCRISISCFYPPAQHFLGACPTISRERPPASEALSEAHERATPGMAGRHRPWIEYRSGRGLGSANSGPNWTVQSNSAAKIFTEVGAMLRPEAL